MGQNSFTKESIKARMFRRAAILWDIRNIDMLDPVVRLLIEALASEIFKLSGEMGDMEDRVVEKLAAVFTPAHTMAASPAHAIVHARAAEGRFTVVPETEFVYKDPRFIQKHNLRKLAFTPAGTFPVINGDVAAFIASGKYYEVTPRGGREHLANATQSPLFTASAWIGLDISPEVESLEGISFYFEFPLLDSSEEYLRLIRHCKWHDGDNPVEVSAGLPSLSAETGVFELFDQRRHLNGDITSKYIAHFMTVSGKLPVSGMKRKALPDEVAPLFGGDAAKGLRDDLAWLKVVFPPAFDDTALSHLTVHVNCFPVANIFRKQTVHNASRLSSILAIEKDRNEYFLFMDSLTDSQDRAYKQVLNHGDNHAAGTYMIRRGGSERFNALDARDFLEKLLDLYRDESIAFSSIDRDIPDTAGVLMDHLSEFEKKTGSYTDDSEHMSYLILGSGIPDQTSLVMRYSLTNGGIANSIRPSEILELPGVADIDPSSAVLMTATRGGRKSPPESSRKEMYHYLLTSRDRIYTREDIRMYCRSHYGECFENVRVENAYEVGREPRQGIIKVIRVILEGAKGKSPVDIELLGKDIYAGLLHRSPEDFEYRIIFT